MLHSVEESLLGLLVGGGSVPTKELVLKLSNDSFIVMAASSNHCSVIIHIYFADLDTINS